MARITAFITAYLNHYFKNLAHANIGDSSGLQPSSAAGNLYWALFTGDPTVSGSIALEADYTGYARQPAARGSGFNVSGNQVSNAGVITFPKNTGVTTDICTYCALMGDLSGSTMLESGLLDNGGLSVTPNVIPEFAIGTLTITAT